MKKSILFIASLCLIFVAFGARACSSEELAEKASFYPPTLTCNSGDKIFKTGAVWRWASSSCNKDGMFVTCSYSQGGENQGSGASVKAKCEQVWNESTDAFTCGSSSQK